jgi:hypothetical protein
MRPERLLALLALSGALLVHTAVLADCTRPATDTERRDCNARADYDARRGNSEVDQAVRRYLESLRRDTDQEAQAELSRSQQEAIQRDRELSQRFADQSRRRQIEYQRDVAVARQQQVEQLSRWARAHLGETLARAERGDVDAMFDVAWRLSPFDAERSRWLFKAAQAGHSGATATLAWGEYDKFFLMLAGFRDDDHPDYESWLQRAAPHFHRARELWAVAAEQGEVSSLAMSSILFWAGSRKKGTAYERDRDRARRYLAKLKDTGALTMHGIVDSFQVHPWFPDTHLFPYKLMYQDAANLHFECFYCVHDGADYDEYQVGMWTDYSTNGLHVYKEGSGWVHRWVHLDMIRREIYPTLWKARAAARAGDRAAASQLAEWGTRKAFPSGLDPALKPQNDWMLRTALRPSGSVWGTVTLPPKPTDRKLIDSDQMGLYMNAAEIAHWRERAGQ